ncbi:Uncharacterised protein [Mycobacteroides abscessus subsp. abscessus]|nr:Uncharacterised protein [Mycobacteroides abscessus subsp. abscessus]
MGARIGSSFWISSLLPAPPPASADATWPLSLPPKIFAMASAPWSWLTWSTVTPPSRSPLAAWPAASFSMPAAVSGSSALCCRPPTSSGTSCCTALFTSPSSAPSLAAISCVGI